MKGHTISWGECTYPERVTGRYVLQAAVSVLEIHRLYEQKQTAPEGAAALDDYLTRWVRWAGVGLVPELVC